MRIYDTPDQCETPAGDCSRTDLHLGGRERGRTDAERRSGTFNTKTGGVEV